MVSICILLCQKIILDYPTIFIGLVTSMNKTYGKLEHLNEGSSHPTKQFLDFLDFTDASKIGDNTD